MKEKGFLVNKVGALQQKELIGALYNSNSDEYGTMKNS